jgi:hypothetical protein
MAKTFTLSDESINESGYRILTSGIDISQFKKNSVMFYNHHRSDDWNNQQGLPIGIWKKIRKEGAELVAEEEIDLEDDFALKISKKVEKGHLKATSIGIRVLEVSTDPKYLEKGQTRPTVTKCKLLEASIVDIPRNGNALVKLYMTNDKGEEEVVELGMEGSIEKLNTILPIIKSTNKLNMKTVLGFLKLKEDASEAEVLAAITQVKNNSIQLAQENDALKAKIKKAEDEQVKSKNEALVDKAISDKKITAADRDTWVGLAEGNYDNTKKALDGMTGFAKLSDTIENSTSEDANLGDFEKYQAKWEKGELLSWEKNNPEEFKRCKLAYYNVVSPE